MKDILRASYDRSAAGYDAGFRELQRPKYGALLGFRGEVVTAAAARGAILDVGAGTGLLLEWLREVAPPLPDGRLVGVELSLGMARLGRGRGLRVAQGDQERLPFRDGAFALACAFTTVGIGGRAPAAALVEIARVLAPGGRAALSVLKADAGALDREIAAAGLTPGARIDAGQDWGYLARKGRR